MASSTRSPKGRFVKGSVPNPGGRTIGSLSLVNILKKKLMEIPQESKYSYAEIFIQKVLDKAIKENDTAMMRDIINRIDGMPIQNIKAELSTKPLLVVGEDKQEPKKLEVVDDEKLSD